MIFLCIYGNFFCYHFNLCIAARIKIRTIFIQNLHLRKIRTYYTGFKSKHKRLFSIHFAIFQNYKIITGISFFRPDYHIHLISLHIGNQRGFFVHINLNKVAVYRRAVLYKFNVIISFNNISNCIINKFISL